MYRVSIEKRERCAPHDIPFCRKRFVCIYKQHVIVCTGKARNEVAVLMCSHKFVGRGGHSLHRHIMDISYIEISSPWAQLVHTVILR